MIRVFFVFALLTGFNRSVTAQDFVGTQKTPARTKFRQIELQLSYDSAGVCYAEKYICKTAASAQQKQQKILSRSAYGWKKLNENQYVSLPEKQRLLEIYRLEQTWVVQVLLTNWSPLQYQMLFPSE